MSWKNEIPCGWEWEGIKWKGLRNFPVYVFKNIQTGRTKGFSGWKVQPATKQTAVKLLKEFIEQEKTMTKE